jgi:hypothetical protein
VSTCMKLATGSGSFSLNRMDQRRTQNCRTTDLAWWVISLPLSAFSGTGSMSESFPPPTCSVGSYSLPIIRAQYNFSEIVPKPKICFLV